VPFHPVTCILSDYSAKMLELAENSITEHCPQVKMGNHQLLRGNKYLTQHLENNMYLWLGGSIGNFFDAEIIEFLNKMDNHGLLK
jgi:uncharacterized SAM-dependent methyltransferase